MKAKYIPMVTFLGWATIYAIMAVATGMVRWHYAALGCLVLCILYTLGLGLLGLWNGEKD